MVVVSRRRALFFPSLVVIQNEIFLWHFVLLLLLFVILVCPLECIRLLWYPSERDEITVKNDQCDRWSVYDCCCWSKNSQWQCILGAAVFVYGDRLCCISEIRIVHEIAVLSSGHRDIIATEKPRHSLHKRTTSNCFERIDRTLIDGRNHWRHKTNDRHMPHWRHTDDDRHQCTIAVRTWRIGEQNCF